MSSNRNMFLKGMRWEVIVVASLLNTLFFCYFFKMLCACSGEQYKFEEPPQSPESLATRDFSASGLSSRTGEWESKFDETQVAEAESTLKEALSLNYEVAIYFFLYIILVWSKCHIRSFQRISDYQCNDFRKLELCWGGLNTNNGTLMLPFKYFKA